MRNHTLVLSETVSEQAKIPRQHWDATLKRELALQLYREGLISFANARRLAALDNVEFHVLLGKRQIPRQYAADDYERDLENLVTWNDNNLDR